MVEAGLVTADKSVVLPLKKVSVIAEVKGCLLGLQASLFYQNDSSDPVEVLFRLPLERSTAVVGLTAVIDGRKITAQLQDKQKARDKYDDAIASGKTAALGEESSGDIFSISLGSLCEGGEAEIQLKMVGEMPIDAEGGVRFSLPATLKPRYTPAGSTDPLAPVEGDSEQVVRGKVKGVHQFELRVLDAEQISSVVSPTHSIVVSREDTLINVTLSDSASLHQDLVVLITHKEPHKPRVLVEPGLPLEKEKQPGFLNHLAVMVNFFPEIPSIECSNEFIFLVDRSGSMSGSFIRSASEALVLFLKSLPEDCYFNIYGFGTTFKSLFSSSVPYNQKNLDTATQHAQQLKADLGGTELLPPLRHIFEQPLVKEKERQIFVLTDGAVNNTTACVDVVKKNATKARCFTFGIGSGASTELVEGLARAGNGSAEFVKNNERLHPKVVHSLKHAVQGAVKNVCTQFTVPDGLTVVQAPAHTPPIFSGEKLVLYGIIAGHGNQNFTGEVELNATIAGKQVCFKMPFQVCSATVCQAEVNVVHHLAGKTLLKEMEQEGKSREDIVKLSVESSVVSSMTAFVAIDEDTQEPVTGPMKVFDLYMDEGTTRTDSLAYQVQQCRALMAHNIDQVLVRGETLDDLSDRAEYLSDDAEVFSKSATRSRRRSSGGVIGSLSSALSSAASAMGSAWSGWRNKQANADNTRAPKLGEAYTSAKDGEECSNNKSSSIVDDVTLDANVQRDKVTEPVQVSLSSMVALQQANGSWSLTTDLATQLSKEMRLIEDGCPSECPMSVWATALAISTLKLTYSSQQDEWELVAKKAESWLRKQTLPSHLSIQDLLSEAENFFS